MTSIFRTGTDAMATARQRAFPFLFVALAALAHAETPPATPSFEARVQLARSAEADERFKTYHAALVRRAGRNLAHTMRSCRAAPPAAEHKPVVLVVDIGPDGRAMAVEAKPDTAAARCLMAGFSAIRYPKPPAYPERAGFPVSMKIGIVH